jgi:GTP 3',8-cyclase
MQCARISRRFVHTRIIGLREKLKNDNPQLATFVKHSASSHVPDPSEINSTGHQIEDKFNRIHNYLRISLTERCNLRCVYCMPEQGVHLTPHDRLLSDDELFQIVDVFASLGVNKIRLTGGEPTLRKDLVDICRNIFSILSSYHKSPILAMTTNGIAGAKNLHLLKSTGLSRINISLDTLDRNKFARITRRTENHWDHVWNTIKTSAGLGFSPVKVGFFFFFFFAIGNLVSIF